MNNSNTQYLFRTHYFDRPWTWMRRTFAILVLDMGALTIPFGDGYFFVNWLVVAGITFSILTKRKDDLGIDMNYLYHFRTSLFKIFSRIDKYKLSDLYSIRCSGIHSDTFELIDFFNGGGRQGGYSNHLEMIFKDDSSKSLELTISRKNLDSIVALANAIRKGYKIENAVINKR